MKRIFTIGDIHGAYKALKQLIEILDLQAEDQLIFLGDYVDGWSESKQVIDYLIALEQQYSCIFIKGNHDVWCEDWLMGKAPDGTWLFHGGKSTLKSYESISDAEKEQHLDFFNRMKNYHIDSNNNLFIHAGFSSMHGPEKETYDSNYRWDRTLWEMAVTMDPRVKKDSILYPKRLKLFREIFIGHTPTTNYDVEVPMHCINVWNLDTGAAFKGKLSALEIQSGKVWQSDVVQSLYPNENGRNKD